VTVHFLQLELGGDLWHHLRDLPSDGARWDADVTPLVRLNHRNGGVIRASTSCSVGPLTTVGSSVAAGTTLIGITTTGALRRWDEYVIGPNAAGEWEWCRLDAIGSGYVKTLDPLVYSYSAGNAFKSHRLSTRVTTAHVGSVELNCWATWSYTVDGQARRTQTSFNISRYAPRLNVTETHILQFDPAAREQIGSDQKLDPIIRFCWENYVLPDVAKLLGSPGAMVAPDAVDAAVLYRVEEYIYRQSRNTERADKYAELYVRQLEEVSSSIVDIDQDGGQSDGEVPPSPRARQMLRG
jgi:hypothetical protein